MPCQVLTVTVFAKTAELSDKTGKFSFCPAKFFGLCDSCPATLFNSQILLIDIFFSFLNISFAFACMFLGKKALKQYHLNIKIIYSSPKLLSVETIVHVLNDKKCRSRPAEANWSQGSRGRRMLRPGKHKSGSGHLKIPKAESAGCLFFFFLRDDYLLWSDYIFDWSKARHVLFVSSVAS